MLRCWIELRKTPRRSLSMCLQEYPMWRLIQRSWWKMQRTQDWWSKRFDLIQPLLFDQKIAAKDHLHSRYLFGSDLSGSLKKDDFLKLQVETWNYGFFVTIWWWTSLRSSLIDRSPIIAVLPCQKIVTYWVNAWLIRWISLNRYINLTKSIHGFLLSCCMNLSKLIHGFGSC